LIYLARAGLLELLQLAGPRVAVPRAVVDEIRAWPTADAAVQALASTPWLEIVPPEPVLPAVLAWDLGAGESAVLAYGVIRPGTELILDDLAARRCAAALGLPVRGTLGLVLNAKKRGTIPAARPLVDQLVDAGMYLSQRVIDAALRQVNE
jgi:predicted nucleic acid-binding protein